MAGEFAGKISRIQLQCLLVAGVLAGHLTIPSSAYKLPRTKMHIDLERAEDRIVLHLSPPQNICICAFNRLRDKFQQQYTSGDGDDLAFVELAKVLERSLARGFYLSAKQPLCEECEKRVLCVVPSKA